MSEYYFKSDKDDKSLLFYNDYLDLFDRKIHAHETFLKKLFLIKLYKKYINLNKLYFYGDFEASFKRQYIYFLNTKKKEIDIGSTNMLQLEYCISYDQLDQLWNVFRGELYILFKENKNALSLFAPKYKVKSFHKIKAFNSSLRNDVFTDAALKPKAKTNKYFIPDFKKVKVWKEFKINYKEILYQYTIENRRNATYYNNSRLSKLKLFKDSLKVILDNKFLDKKLLYPKYLDDDFSNDLYFVFEDDIAYRLSENYTKLEQVEDLEFDDDVLNEDEEENTLQKFLRFQLEYYSKRTEILNLAKKKIIKKFNALDDYIVKMQRTEIHKATSSSMYHEILLLNANDFFKNLLKD